jgi:hypothetical protein
MTNSRQYYKVNVTNISEALMKGIHSSSWLQGCCNHQFNDSQLLNLTTPKKLKSFKFTFPAAYNAK